MKESLDLRKYSVRTDLAVEAREMVLTERNASLDQQENLSQIDGVMIKEKEEDGIKLSLVQITEDGEKQLAKSRAST